MRSREARPAFPENIRRNELGLLRGRRGCCGGKFFADAGEEFLASFGGLDVALALVEGALNLFRLFIGQLFLKLLLHGVDVLHLPNAVSIFKGLIAHRSLWLDSA